MKPGLLFVIAFVVLAGIGRVAMLNTGPGFDYEGASSEERQAWLDEEAKTIAEDVRKGIGVSGLNRAQMDLQDVVLSDEDKLLDIVVVAKGSVRTYRPKDFRMEFLQKMCPVYERSTLAKLGFRTRLKLVRENGDIAVAETVSKAACDQYRAFKKRRAQS